MLLGNTGSSVRITCRIPKRLALSGGIWPDYFFQRDCRDNRSFFRAADRLEVVTVTRTKVYIVRPSQISDYERGNWTSAPQLYRLQLPICRICGWHSILFYCRRRNSDSPLYPQRVIEMAACPPGFHPPSRRRLSNMGKFVPLNSEFERVGHKRPANSQSA